MSSQYWWRLGLLATVLVLGGLIFGSRPLEIASQTQGVTPTSKFYLQPIISKLPPISNEIATQPPGVTSTNLLYFPLMPLNFQPPPPARNYYVDSSSGNDGNSCTSAQNPKTPKRTVSGVLSCNPGPGEIVRFKGVFTETIIPTRSGTVLYDVQDIAQVNGSVVTFNQTIAEINPNTDFVTIYGSRKGNSGAFAIVSMAGNRVTVDTADLPATQFLPEAASDPGTLQAAILRPVHFTAWDINTPPIWDGYSQTFHSINQSVIMLSYIRSLNGYPGPSRVIWPAVEIDGDNSGNSDFLIFDHLEIANVESAIAVEFNEFHSNYDIIQFSNLHDTGYPGNVSDEVIYFGQAYHPERHHDFVQIMYNKVGPHKQDYSTGTPTKGDGIEIKPSAHNATIFGNEIVGIQPNGCDDAPIKVTGTNAFIANNYVHNINPQAYPGCGISIIDDTPLDPTGGGEGAIVVNNIVANVKRVGIRVLDADNVQIINNTLYNIFPEPECDSACMEHNMGIEVQNWQGATRNIVIKNNIVQSAYIGIGRYIWSNDYPSSIDSDYNLIFNANYPFRGTITQNTHDRVTNPGLVDPQNHNFALMAASPARDSGVDLPDVFTVDNHDAADPSLPAITAPILRNCGWDIGAYEYEEILTYHYPRSLEFLTAMSILKLLKPYQYLAPW